MTPPNIPFFYRLWHLYLEPVFALGGVYHLHWVPREYLTFMPPTTSYHAGSQIVYDQLAAMYLFFAFVEGILLRVVDDIRIWRYIVFGLALCDAGHCYAAWCEMGTQWMFTPTMWTQKDLVTNVLNWLPLLTRISFVLGIGLKSDAKVVRRN